ncbi:P-II family nitrogen regulator [Nitrosopumilus maritimus]|uniref:Nitrogen regulatory protein P-II n=1 Tax=Nitrosopumilus maritimus (strain SCM1) TaxID=436308 RepID=A9A2H4_NITMS|nr:P-II family nitrogen regulator [Nitrosopumilus maritimus]ABX13213.1 nitrogen regulatory protein P-II [Nitrosopumilus maritimus SCM1]
MKKVEAIVNESAQNAVIDAMRKVGISGVTVSKVQGQGAQDPPLVGDFFSRVLIVCVVDDPKLDEILDAIAGAACTGTKGDGKVYVSDICDALDICTKKRGTMDI